MLENWHIQQDGKEILCRRSHLTCAGYSACEYINPALVNQERFELDPESLEDVLKIQIGSRLQEADTPEKLALMYVLSFSKVILTFSKIPHPLVCLVFLQFAIQAHAPQRMSAARPVWGFPSLWSSTMYVLCHLDSNYLFVSTLIIEHYQKWPPPFRFMQ